MSITFISTKIHIPLLRPLLVERPRLMEKLNQGCQTKLTLIFAPLGYGKSSLVSECRLLWQAIHEEYKHCKSFSNFWETYSNVFPQKTHHSAGKDSGETNHMEYGTLEQYP